MIFNNFLTNAKTLWERTVNLDLSANADMGFNIANDAARAALEDKPHQATSYAEIHEKAVTNTYGFSIKIIFGKLCFVNRGYKQDGMKIIVNTTVKVFFARKKKFMKKLEHYIRQTQLDLYNAMNYNDSVIINNCETYNGRKMKRSLDSIFTDGDIHKELYEDIKKFLDNKEIYKKLNYPYNYCALLYGVPGSGKSSTLLAIATALNRKITYINLATASSVKLLRQLNDEPNDTIYVFEDIDAVSTKSTISRSKKDKSMKDILGDDLLLKSLSLSDLLNITDGLLASDGTICLFTTNHIEKLDPAFLRAGRMNKTVEYKYMSALTANKMIEAYLGKKISNLKDDIRPAELQEMILNIMVGKKTEKDLKETFCK